MDKDARYQKNDRAYRRMKSDIDAKYPNGRFVALADGRIVADAPTLDELRASLASNGVDQADVFVARAGEDYPVYADILVG